MSVTKKIVPYIFLSFLFVSNNADGSSLNFNGYELAPIKVSAPANTGLNDIYVLWSTTGVSVNYTSDGGKVEWSRYSNLGGGYAEEIQGVSFDGNSSTLSRLEGDMGYIIKEGDKNLIFWVIDYGNKQFDVRELTISPDQNCGETVLDFIGNAGTLTYYTVTGRQEILSREITLNYYNLDWDSNGNSFIQEEVTKTLSSITNNIIITPPVYCSTSFFMVGDRFLRQWGKSKEYESNVFYPMAVNVMTEARQEGDYNNNNPEDDEGEMPSSNIIGGNNDGLGGSAPCTINFTSYATDAVVHNEWQFADDSEFEYITHRITEADLTYTFTEEGTTYVRFVGSNSDGSCEAYGDTYAINIGSSELLIPNAFSPDGDGINDEWKVAYRSLIEFKCWIYDRHGHEIYHFDDPSNGWDGKKNGKYVKPGVYFYVIQAKGADGKKYKKSGDINILKTSRSDYYSPEEL